MIARIFSKAFYGVAGVVLMVMAVWGEVTSSFALSPLARLTLGVLGLALFVGAFRPPKKGGDA